MLTDNHRIGLVREMLGLHSDSELDHFLQCQDGCELDDGCSHGVVYCTPFLVEFRNYTPPPPRTGPPSLTEKLWSETILDTLKRSYPVLRFPDGYQVQP